MNSLNEAKKRQWALPNVLPHQRSEKLCDELSREGMRNVAVRLPVFAPSRSTGVRPEPATPGATVVLLDELPLPTKPSLERHKTKFAPTGLKATAKIRADHRETVDVTAGVFDVYRKWGRDEAQRGLGETQIKLPSLPKAAVRKKAVKAKGGTR